jgi:hypothetical protein
MNTLKLTDTFPAPPGAITSYYSIDLNIIISPGKLQVAQVDLGNEKIYSLSEYAIPEDNQLAIAGNFLEEEELFHKPYRREIVAIDHPRSTLVPNDIFQQNKMEQYLSLVHDLPEDQVFFNDEIKPDQIRNVYCLPQDWLTVIQSKLPAAILCHMVTPLLTGLSYHSKSRSAEWDIFCHIRHNTFDLVIFNKSKLHYHNSFHFGNKEEFVYYILFVFDQLALQPGEQEVVFLGELGSHPQVIHFSRDFIRTVTTNESFYRDMNLALSGDPEIGRYFNLLSLSLCG